MGEEGAGMKPKLLFVGDAVVSTGFSRCTHAALPWLARDWDVSVLGINYNGDPHDLTQPDGTPFKVYPACRAFTGEDAFGVRRFGKLVLDLRPDAAVLLNDPWNIPVYMDQAADVPVVGWVAVDHENCRGAGMNDLSGAVFWTQFGEAQARKGGYTQPSAVVPLGVGPEFRPLPQDIARTERIGIPERVRDHFLVGVVGRNQERKRLDLVFAAFAEWQRLRDVKAALVLHIAPTGDDAYDIDNLVSHFGLAGKVVKLMPNIGKGFPDDGMPWVYACFDAFLSMAQGEGWNLPALEAMACGIPVVLPDQGGPAEWSNGAALKVPCPTLAFTPWKVNALHRVPDPAAAARALDQLYVDHGLCQRMTELGLEVAGNPSFRWDAVGRAFADAVKGWAWPGVPAAAPEEVRA